MERVIARRAHKPPYYWMHKYLQQNQLPAKGEVGEDSKTTKHNKKEGGRRIFIASPLSAVQ